MSINHFSEIFASREIFALRLLMTYTIVRN